jgi:hypothetical protein
MKTNSNWVLWWKFVQKIFKEVLLNKKIIIRSKDEEEGLGEIR